MLPLATFLKEEIGEDLKGEEFGLGVIEKVAVWMEKLESIYHPHY